MYLRGSKWRYNRRRRHGSPFRIMFLVMLVAGALYVNQVVVPATPPMFVPTPTLTRAPESYTTEAENFYAEGKILQAIGAYKEAVQANPTPSNFIALARLQIYNNEFEEAATNAENALLLNSNNSMAHAVRGWAYAFLGNYLQAEAAINRALEIDPNNAIAYAYMAETQALKEQAGQGDLTTQDKAIAASRQAIELGPNLFETRRARGLVLEITGNYEEAVTEFEAAVKMNPNIADLHIALGRNYRQLQIYDKAVEEFTRAAGLSPRDPMPLLLISRTYNEAGVYSLAIQYGQQAIKANPTDPFLYGNLGQAYYRSRTSPSDTIKYLGLAVQGGVGEDNAQVEGLPLNYGRIAEYYYMYGLTLARQGQCGEALKISQLMADGVPNDETAVYNAQEMVNICQEIMDAGGVLPTETPEPES
jgi:tetratricopeptide (TPR) repeat protein